MPSLLDRVAARLRETGASGDGEPSSLLIHAGSRYSGEEAEGGAAGFDPAGAALFEAVVESAYLVAAADDDFDATERAAFEHVVLSACKGSVSPEQLGALLADLESLREEDGTDKRVRMVARTVSEPDHAREVLRIAALIAHVSEGVSDVERAVLQRMAAEFRLAPAAVDEALADVERALA